MAHAEKPRVTRASTCLDRDTIHAHHEVLLIRETLVNVAHLPWLQASCWKYFSNCLVVSKS